MNIEIIHSFQEKHYLGKCKIRDLLGSMDKIENWEYNRPPDLERSREISNAILQQKNAIDWVLHFSYDSVTKYFQVIDGIHRVYSLEMVKNNESFIHIDASILINFKVDASKGELVDWFHAINNSNPVPELYLRDTSTEKRECIEKIAKEWQEKYPGHFMSSKKPNIGHINRDRFIDVLDGLYDKYKKTHSKLVSMEETLREKMETKNRHIQENLPKKISLKIRDKCVDSGCYLFLQKSEWLIDNI
jgi:hypothetical protein